MRLKLFYDKNVAFAFFLFMALMLVFSSAACADTPDKVEGGELESIESGGVILQRVIKVEGELEKPRVIFIVPRSRLWKGDFLNKSYIEELLVPIHPASLTKQGVIAPQPNKGSLPRFKEVEVNGEDSFFY